MSKKSQQRRVQEQADKDTQKQSQESLKTTSKESTDLSSSDHSLEIFKPSPMKLVLA